MGGGIIYFDFFFVIILIKILYVDFEDFVFVFFWMVFVLVWGVKFYEYEGEGLRELDN